MGLLKKDVDFGQRPSITWDTSVKVTKLSKEQLERLRNGEKLENILTGEEEIRYEKPQRYDDFHLWDKSKKKKSEEKKEVLIDPGDVNGLTVEEYTRLKGKGLSDAKIREKYNISHGKMIKFKKANNLIGKFDIRFKQEVPKKEENASNDNDMEKTEGEQMETKSDLSFEEKVDNITSRLAGMIKDKNSDYGDSFAKLYRKYGDISTAIRLADKLNRFETLIEKECLVKDESIEDTLLDIAGYCVLTLIQKEETQ